jgi:ABC-type dipeptide/oligopeptide/nickel transport system ATPase component
MDPVMSVRDLRVRIGSREIVHGVGFDVRREQTLGIVGESGSGKSMTVLAATGLLDTPGAVVDGSSTLAGDQGPQLVGASGRLLPACTAAGSVSCSRIRAPHSTRCSRLSARSPNRLKPTGT